MKGVPYAETFDLVEVSAFFDVFKISFSSVMVPKKIGDPSWQQQKVQVVHELTS